MKTFSAIWTDKLGAAIKAACTETYHIEFCVGSDDFKAFAHAVEQGIDSHLEAIIFKESVRNGKVRYYIEPASVPVLVRRLLESEDDYDAGLASAICSTLEIELV